MEIKDLQHLRQLPDKIRNAKPEELEAVAKELESLIEKIDREDSYLRVTMP